MKIEDIKHYTRIFFLIPLCAILLIVFIVKPELSLTDTVVKYHKGTKDYLNGIFRGHGGKYGLDGFAKDDQTIDLPDTYRWDFPLLGTLLNERGPSRDVTYNVTSSLIHSFSPDIERAAESKFVDPAKDQVYFANSPAFIFYEGEIILVIRIWLQREKYERMHKWPANDFADNYFFTQKFDRRFRPLDKGSIMGMPTPKWYVGDGPIEPRVIRTGKEVLITFNTGIGFNKTNAVDYTIWWYYFGEEPKIPEIKGFNPMMHVVGEGLPRDKHWAAYIYKKELYFVHNIDPLRILKCSLNGTCLFHHYEGSREVGKAFSNYKTHLRGGTPFEHYEGAYYLGFAHSALYKKRTGYHRYYSTHLLVLNAETNRFVYCSAAIEVHREVMMSAPMVRRGHIEDYFIFPVGIILEDKDAVTMGVHINDYSSVAIRLRGIRKLMRGVMALDKLDNPKHGPPPDTLQQYIMAVEHNRTGLVFTDH